MNPSRRRRLRHWSHANEINGSPIHAERERQLSGREFYLVPTSGRARQNISTFRDDRASSLSLNCVIFFIFFSSLFLSFFITTWRVSKATYLLHPQPACFFSAPLTRTTRHISDSGVTRYAILSHSEESINPPNECKLPRSRGKGPCPSLSLAPRALSASERWHGQKSTQGVGSARLPRGDDVYTSGNASNQMQMSEKRENGGDDDDDDDE